MVNLENCLLQEGQDFKIELKYVVQECVFKKCCKKYKKEKACKKCPNK